MPVFILIEANEGTTGLVLVAQGRHAVAQVIGDCYDQQAAPSGHPAFCEEDRVFAQAQKAALLVMVAPYTWVGPGRYLLENREPHWQAWTLIITQDTAYFLE